jgi:hypothetical protein
MMNGHIVTPRDADGNDVAFAEGALSDDVASQLVLVVTRTSTVELMPVALRGDSALVAVPHGSIPLGRFKPRAGPLYRRVLVEAVPLWDMTQDDEAPTNMARR